MFGLWRWLSNRGGWVIEVVVEVVELWRWSSYRCGWAIEMVE